jgi:thiosulfate/3-mercaptopyruvate sulfurtransferase
MSARHVPGGPLIDQAELANQLSSGQPLVLLDIRWRLGGPPGIDS